MLRTNTYSIVIAMIRVSAIFALAKTLPALINAGFNFNTPTEWGDDYWKIMAAATSLGTVMFLFLWMFPDWLAKLAFLRGTDETFEIGFDIEAIQRIVIVGIGLFFLTSGLINLIYYVAYWLSLNFSQVMAEYADYQIDRAQIAGMVSNLVQIISGYLLVRFAPQMGQKIQRIQVGLSDDPPSH